MDIDIGVRAASRHKQLAPYQIITHIATFRASQLPIVVELHKGGSDTLTVDRLFVVVGDPQVNIESGRFECGSFALTSEQARTCDFVPPAMTLI